MNTSYDSRATSLTPLWRRSSTNRFAIWILLGALAFSSPLFAQTPTEVLYKQDFQSLGTQANPSGWVDTAIGNPSPVADGLYKTWPDPTQGSKAPNVVYGSKSGSGKPEGRNPRIGTFSTLTTHSFDAKGRFEFSGRLIRTRDDARVGVTFLSQYPTADKYYLFGLWSQPTSSKLTMQLFAFDKSKEDPTNPLGDQSARMTGVKDSGVSLTKNVWYRFAIRVDDADGKTKIKAKIWENGSEEPEAFQIEAEDASPERLTKGRIGMWSAVKGETYIDEILAKSPVDHAAPTIQFFREENGTEVSLPDGHQSNLPVTPVIVATDDTDPNPAVVATLDGEPFVSRTLVATEGTHLLEVVATDALGNSSNAQVSFYIDSTSPVVRILEGTTPLVPGHVFSRDVSINLEIDDLSGTTVVATLNGQPFTPGTPLAPAPPYGGEAHPHELLVTVTDVVGNSTTLPPAHFSIDKTKPVLRVTRGGETFAGGAFNVDVALDTSVEDLTPTTVLMTLSGAPYTPGTPVTTDGEHSITATATDDAGNQTTVGPITFTINKTGPGVRFVEDGRPVVPDKHYARAVPLAIEVTNILPPTVTATLDGVAWPVSLVSSSGNVYLFANSAIATEGAREVVARVTDASGNDVTASIRFTVDLTAPSLTILESGSPLSGSITLGRDAVLSTEASDAIALASASMTRNGQPFVSGTRVSEEGQHVVAAVAADEAGNTTPAGPFTVTVDKSAPVVSLLEGADPFPAEHWFNRDVTPVVETEDLTDVTVEVSIDGVPAAFSPAGTTDGTTTWTGPTVTTEGGHTIVANVTDEVGLVTTVGPVTFHIDKTSPVLTLTTPAAGSVVTAAAVALSGAADDAVTVLIGAGSLELGTREAAIEPSTGTWTLDGHNLLEGTNTITIVGTDRAGNVTTLESTIVLDTRGPALQVLAPANGGCSRLPELVVSGTASDARLASVMIVVDGAAPVAASIDASAGTWSASLSGLSEGARNLTITASDGAGHTSTATLGVRIDRTKPVIEVTEGGALFSLPVVNRALALFVRAIDADPSVSVTSVLDGTPFVSGSSIAGEGSHTLAVTARDCAGNEETKTIPFTIDLTPPVVEGLTPANGAVLGDMPSNLTGVVTDHLSQVASVELVGTGITATPANSAFTLSGVPFAEGTNRFTLRARDVAGNEATLDYVVTVRTEAPTVTISENGTPIASGALFNRDLTPEIVSSDPEASITATLGGAAYVPGTAITSEGTHTLVATATNALGKAGSKTVQFTIDKSGPAVAITSPANGASTATDVVTVTGTATGATSVLVSGVTTTLSGTTFTANIALDLGENVITAVARDEAGNSARADVTVTRAGSGPAIVLLHPPDKSLTNRPETEVMGRVISPANVSEVEISAGAGPGVRVTPNPAGDFRLSDVQLLEGNNTITATAIGTDGKTTSVTISLTGDFTAPTLEIFANGTALDEGARFPESPGLTLQASDDATAEPVTTLLLDGGVLPAVIADGGHLVVATATDAAGNTTRLERTFFVGESGTGTTGCSVTSLDPASGSVITSTVTRLAGRTSAPAVQINGVATEVVDGSFCTTVELPAEGANPIEIVCTTLAGEPIGDPVALALIRSTGQPSVTITAPAEGQVFTPAASGTATKITVTGEAGPGVVSVSVNGIVKSLDGTDLGATRAFSVENVPLAGGLNILAVRGETAAKRAALATRRVVLLEGTPRIAITSSIGSVPTGATSVDVSGTWANLDPATLAVTGGAAVSSTRLSDTNGTFVANVPLAIGVNTITVDGRFGSLAAEPASVTVTRSDSAPWVAIATPDNTFTAADTIEVTGTFAADAGARVEVSGVAATLSGDTFSATATLSTVPGAPNTIVARVIELDGGVSVDTILVTRFVDEFDVEETFPASGSTQIPVTFQLLARFTHDMDATTVSGSIRLEDAAGQQVSGILRTDRDVVTFAPSAPLGAGETYTLRATTGLRDLAGRTLGTDYVATFTTEPGPATAAPQLAALPQVYCGETLPVTGTAPSGARIRLDTAGLQFFTNANASGAFRFDVPVIGAEGYRLVRARIVGTDGSMSEAAESCLRIECGGPQVVSAEFDRTVNSLTITFNRDIDPATVVMGSTVLLDRAGLPVSGTVSQSSGTTFVVTPSEDLTESSFRLTVTTGVEDTSGNALRFPFTESFTLGGAPIDVPPGHGYITGEVYDATTGRPLQGAVVLGAPTSPSAGPPASPPALTDSRGRYAMALPEGAHTIEVTAPGHTTVWRQIVVPAGTGVVPIDIRLTTHGVSAAIASTDLTIQHGGETPVTTPVTLTVPSGSLTAGSTVTLTSVGTQSIAGLLPLGWSPLASAEVLATDASTGLGARASSPASARTNVPSSPRPATAGSTAPVSPRPATAGRGAGGEGLSGSLTTTPITATLTFTVRGDAITTAAQTLTAVRYDATRDEWHVLDAAVNVTNDTATISLTSDGAYALVYPDKGPGLTTPPTPSGGTALVGITDPCTTPNACGELVKDTFTLDPPVVLPDQRTTATLRVNSTLNTQHSTFPSGTAVQAYIDEELQLADGSTITDPPFATDLLLYRGLDGGAGEARFHLAPSKRAAEVILQVGYEHIRIHPYPGRLDRGTLIGNEGGRVPGDGTVAIDIPEGAAPEPVHAEVAHLSESALSGFAPLGYTVLGGFDFTLSRATSTAAQDLDGDGQPDEVAPVQLFKPASMTYVVDAAQLPAPDSQIILAEVLSGDNAGIIRLTALMSDTTSSAKTAQSGRSFQLRPGTGTTESTSSQAARAKTFQLRSGTGTTTSTEAEVENFGHLTAETAIRYTTTLPTTQLPVDGLTREGTYLVLAANQPVAYATGLLRTGTAVLQNALLTASAGALQLGTADLSRTTGVVAIPVPAAPAAPFTLDIQHRQLGNATPYVHPSSPAKGEIVTLSSLTFTQVPLTITGSAILKKNPDGTYAEAPAENATEVSLTTFVRLTFSSGLDPTSASSTISLVDTASGTVVSGTVSVAGNAATWNPDTNTRLNPNSRYALNVAPTLLSSTGVAFGQSKSISFSTITQLLGGGINRDAISITIPDENGVSTVKGIGSADPTKRAVPSNAVVQVVRRGHDFVTQYQTQADVNGHFQFSIGTAGGDDRVTICDVIDLHVVSDAGILTAVVRLTPFVSADGKGFIASPDRETRFTSVDGITVTVPAGAFDEPKEIRVAPSSKEVFAEVPNIDHEWTHLGGVRIEFEGLAKKRLDLEFAPSVAPRTGQQLVLGRFVDSVRGPRLTIADTLRVVDGRFSTTFAPASAQARYQPPQGSGVLIGDDAKRYMNFVERQGDFAAYELSEDLGITGELVWLAFETSQFAIEGAYSIISNMFLSYILPDEYVVESRGRVVVPALKGREFTITGINSDTGFDAFTRQYRPIIDGDPGAVVLLDPPDFDLTGPYPVFATPASVVELSLDRSRITLSGLQFDLANDFLSISVADAAKLPEGTTVQLVNLTTGFVSQKWTAGGSGSLVTSPMPASRNQSILLLRSNEAANPDATISVVFNEPLWLPSLADGTAEDDEAYLASTIKLTQLSSIGPLDLSDHVTYETDSNGRRVYLLLPAPLANGSRYRLTLAKDLVDRGGNKLATVGTINESGQVSWSVGGDLVMELATTEPSGSIASFDLTPADIHEDGALRDLARIGNLAFVSARDGGILAYDLSDPAFLVPSAAQQPKPYAVVPARWQDDEGNALTPGFDEHWGIATDHHGRIYSTGFSAMFGAIRGYRVEDFVAANRASLCEGFPSAPARSNCRIHGAAVVSWSPGYAMSLPTESRILLSDRPEGTPRTLKILVIDDEETYTFEELKALAGVTSVADGEFKRLSVPVQYRTPDETPYYISQRVTIENVTLGNRWSADVRVETTGRIEGVLGRGGDKFRILRNRRTYALVSLFGYGVSLIDMNAVESNDQPQFQGYKRPREQRVVSDIPAEEGSATPIRSLAFSPEAVVVPGGTDEYVPAFAPDPSRGLLGFMLFPGEESFDRGEGLVLKNRATGQTHPRLARIDQVFETMGRIVRARFSSVAHYRSPRTASTPSRDYVLLAGGDYGLLAIQAGEEGWGAPNIYIAEDSLVGAVWIPDGAWAVRHVAGTNLAVVVDGLGRVLLIDLTRIDEIDLTTTPDELFPTTLAALNGEGDGSQVGVDDPRILWKSEPGVIGGTIAPIVDPTTGVILGGRINERAMTALSAFEHEIQMLWREGTLTATGGNIPLGIKLPKDLAARFGVNEDGNAAAFRLAVTLPRGIARAVAENGVKLTVAVESEIVPGAIAKQTEGALPPAHLRLTTRAGEAEELTRRTEVVLTPLVPEGAAGENAWQSSANTFVSPWIVGMADPRASQRLAGEGPCIRCEAPADLQPLVNEGKAFELLTAGRHIAVRLDAPVGQDLLAGTGYEYLSRNGRLTSRFTTVMADTVRDPEVRVPGQNPPVAEGMFQETVFVPSGEVQTSNEDLTVAGRGGMDVVVTRTHNSRTIGGSGFGLGWESNLFRRLRSLPDGSVEYRDETGEIWDFTPSASTAPADAGEQLSLAVARYDAPKGLFLKLVRTERGWTMFDQEWRITTFDSLGRLTSESDEFFSPSAAAAGEENGNTIRYAYDESGHLVAIIDPLGRETRLTWWTESDALASGAYAGLVRKIEDWRGRSVEYHYDKAGRLTRVLLPEVAATTGVPVEGGLGGSYSFTGNLRPRIEYGYATVTAPSQLVGNQAYNDYLELAGNLTSIMDPREALKANGTPRVRFTYDGSTDPVRRDRVLTETWPCGTSGETCTPVTAKFPYASGLGMETIDVLGQRRSYELTTTAQYDGRVHVARETVHAVPTLELAGEALPAAAPVTPPVEDRDLTTSYIYDEHGQVASSTRPSGLVVTNTYKKASNGAPGMVLQSVKETPPDGDAIETIFAFDADAPNAANTVTAVGKRQGTGEPLYRDDQSPSRDRLTIERRDDGVTSSAVFDKKGQLVAARKFASGATSPTISTTIAYHEANAPRIAAGQPSRVTQGGGQVAYRMTYDTTPDSGTIDVIEDERSSTRTTTRRDAWDRVGAERIEGPNGEVIAEERYGYDADGNLAYTATRQSDPVSGEVRFLEESYEYDLHGRVTAARSTGARVGDTLQTLTTRREYDLSGRTFVTIDPVVAGSEIAAREITIVDGLGREVEQRRVAGSGGAEVREVMVYDIHGNDAFSSDSVRVATLRQHDAFGREIRSVSSDGTSTQSSWNAWDELTSTEAYDSSGALVAKQTYSYSRDGEPRRVAEQIDDAGEARVQRFTWDDGERNLTSRLGRAASVSTDFDPLQPVRVQQTVRDEAGRVVEQKIGTALGPESLIASEDTYAATKVLSFKGSYPAEVQTAEPRAGRAFHSAREYDALGRPRVVTEAGTYVATAKYDEAGNPVEITAPGMKPSAMRVDGRGLPFETTLPDGGTIRQSYDALGNMRRYVSEAGEATIFETDGLGRIHRIRYPDGTCEEIVYENLTGLVRATRDRAGQWLLYSYDSGGRVKEVFLGAMGSGCPEVGAPPSVAPDPVSLWVRSEYDPAGRLTKTVNKDTAIELEGYDMLGRPSVTRTIRYRDETGLTTANVLDVHVQKHVWSVFDGERLRWRMPAAGSQIPNVEAESSWRTWIGETRDGVGNLVEQSAAAGATAAPDAVIAKATARGVGRLVERQRPLANGIEALLTRYGYADGAGSASNPVVPVVESSPGPASGLLGRVETSIGERTIAGSEVERDAAKRVHKAEDLRRKGRTSEWTYDDRGRLAETILAGGQESAVQPMARQRTSDADFATHRAMLGRLTPNQRAQLGDEASDMEPPSWASTAGPGQRIKSRAAFAFDPSKTLEEQELGEPDAFSWDGGRRASDGEWTSQYDAEGRRIATWSLTAGRKIEYVYDARSRIVGRTALRLTDVGSWIREDRTAVLNADGLPAETTWVWDPIVDRLVAVYEAGASTVEGATVEAGLLRQIIHGDQAVDDPVEVLVRDGAGVVNRYLPVIDYAAGGSLEAVVGAEGAIVDEVLYADAYGDAPRYLTGPVVDRVTLHRSGAGREIRVRLTAEVREDTAAEGVRVTALDASGAELRVAPVVSSVGEDGVTVVLGVAETDWSAFTAGAVAIEIGVTDKLRAAAWGESQAQRAPPWQGELGIAGSRAGVPVVVKSMVGALEEWWTSAAAGQDAGAAVYEVTDLYLVGSGRSASQLLFDFHALPYREPATGEIFARERWYDPSTASFISPDPLGMQDSSNLYAFAGLDPVNYRDPLGLSKMSKVDDIVEFADEVADEGFTAIKRLFRKGGDEAAEAGEEALERAAKRGRRLAKLGGAVDEGAKAGIAGGKSARRRTSATARARRSASGGGYRNKLTKEGRPYAKPGPKTDPNAPHNRKIRQIIEREKAKGRIHIGGGWDESGQRVTEQSVVTAGGKKELRRMDASFVDPVTKEIHHFNVGRVTKRGRPVKREVQALLDVLQRANPKHRRIKFEAYWP